MRALVTGMGLTAALLSSSSTATAGEVFAYDLRGTDRLVSWDESNPLIQTVIDAAPEATGYATYGMDFNTAGTNLYVVNHLGSSLQLDSVDPVTGVHTFGPFLTNFPAAVNETGLSMDPTTETLYLSTGSDLYTVDPMTGVATYVALFSGMTPAMVPMGLVIDIAIDASGNMFANDISNDCLWAVDKTTGTGTFIAVSNHATNFAQGMDFDPETNTLYAALYTGGGTGSYGTWDTTTGVFTILELLPNIPDFSNEFELAIRGTPVSDNTGSAYCFGDGTGASCPCSAFGAPGQGCANTTGMGAVLTGSGNGSFGNDTFQLDIVGVPGDKPGLILRGDSQITTPAGDGILCTTGATQRSHVQITSMGATTYTDFSGSPFGSVANAGGAPTNFQFWYRDPQNLCSGGGFNFTNAWTVTYLP